ncbi:uncharacterized protein LOC110728637 [Chenopodium quinoa]|uniref:uncharacterized protein LOC110728637 n=1 Tax=Chenopodium quinoa TaxID=63459 RepID=UPI000B76FEF8|nr:uncharacterized protein LOC110728637 [Chenopodium quinoa]
MAVKSRLMQRHILQDDICSICGNSEETINHALFECEAAKTIWNHCEFRYLLSEAPTGSFGERWNWLSSKLKEYDVLRVAGMLWAAWRCHNMRIYGNSTPNPVMMAANYCKMVEDYQYYAERVYHCRAGLGVVVRDNNGSMLLTATKKITQLRPDIAEAMAISYAMSTLLRFGYNSAWIESDALNIVSAITKRHYGAAPIFHILEEIRALYNAFNVCIFSHVKRNSNTVAHLVARGDIGECQELIRTDSFPESIVSLSMLDLSSN